MIGTNDRPVGNRPRALGAALAVGLGLGLSLVAALAFDAQPAAAATAKPKPRVTAKAPVGRIDLTWGTAPGTIRTIGWMVDPDTSAPLQLWMSIDSRLIIGTADVPRGDLPASLRKYGSRHGYDISVNGVGPGVHQVCVAAVNKGRARRCSWSVAPIPPWRRRVPSAPWTASHRCPVSSSGSGVGHSTWTTSFPWP